MMNAAIARVKRTRESTQPGAFLYRSRCARTVNFSPAVLTDVNVRAGLSDADPPMKYERRVSTRWSLIFPPPRSPVEIVMGCSHFSLLAPHTAQLGAG